jgi:hypothetical protein
VTGPSFSKPPTFNHVALSLPADDLDEAGRAAIVAFYGDVLGFEEYAELTKDRAQLVLRAHTHEQFVFLVGDPDPMTAAPLDHFGLSVATLDEFHEVARRAAAWKERLPEDVDLDEPSSEVFVDALRLHSFYVRYRLPLRLEVQHFEFLV